MLDHLLGIANLVLASHCAFLRALLLAIVRGRGRKSQKEKEWEIQTATWGISDDPWDKPPQSNVPPPPPTTPAQAESLFQAAERIERQDLDREQYVAQRPVMNPVRTPVDDALLNDLDIGTSQKQSSSSIDTSFLDDLL